MTPTHPSPEAMEAAAAIAYNWSHGRVETSFQGTIAAALDAFAAAAVEAERAACEGAVLELSYRTMTGAHQALSMAVAAIADRRSKG